MIAPLLAAIMNYFELVQCLTLLPPFAAQTRISRRRRSAPDGGQLLNAPVIEIPLSGLMQRGVALMLGKELLGASCLAAGNIS